MWQTDDASLWVRVYLCANTAPEPVLFSLVVNMALARQWVFKSSCSHATVNLVQFLWAPLLSKTAEDLNDSVIFDSAPNISRRPCIICYSAATFSSNVAWLVQVLSHFFHPCQKKPALTLTSASLRFQKHSTVTDAALCYLILHPPSKCEIVFIG